MKEQCFEGKRLLVLGCSNNANDISAFAERTGIRIIIAGSYFSKEMLEIADEAYYVDIYDSRMIVDTVRNRNIDGVFVGGNENIISSVIDAMEELHMPFYSSRELWDTLMNKVKFKEACRKHGVPTVEDYIVDEENIEEMAETLPYPVVIKPVDNSGSTGVAKCERKEDFAQMYSRAKGLSKTGKATVEEYIEGDNIIVYYTFSDGQVSLSSMADKYMRGNKHDFNPLAEAHSYPSRHLSKYIENVDENMRRMLLELGIKNGITSMQGFVSGDRFAFFEMGYRLGGTAQYRYTNYVNGMNSLDMMLSYALTGKMDGYDRKKDNAAFRYPCCTITLMSKGGVVGKIEGLEEARKKEGVIWVENRYNEGDTIKITKTVSQFHIRAYLVGKTVDEVKALIRFIQETIKVYDASGNNMLEADFNVDRLDYGDNFTA